MVFNNNGGSSLNSRLKLVFLGGLALLVLILAGVLLARVDFAKLFSSQVETIPPGTLLLSYQLVDEENDSAQLVPVVFDFSKREATVIYDSQEGEVTWSGMHHSISQNGEWLAYIDQSPVIIESDIEAEPETMGYVGWPDAVYVTRLPLEISLVAEPIASSTMPAFPSVSDTGNLLYMMASSTDGFEVFYPNAAAEDWQIVLWEEGSGATVLANGSYPHWIDEDKFLYLQNDGIYIYSLADAQGELLTRSLSPVTAFHKLQVDRNRTRVLLVEPAASALRIFDLSEDNGEFSLNENEPILEAITSAIFSDDGRYIVATLLPGDYATASSVPLAVYEAGVKVYEATLPKAGLMFTTIQSWLP